MKQHMYHAQTHSANWQYGYAPNPAVDYGYFVVPKYMNDFVQTSPNQTSSKSNP